MNVRLWPKARTKVLGSNFSAIYGEVENPKSESKSNDPNSNDQNDGPRRVAVLNIGAFVF
jgi:hypothetical protein